jgi:hypothetical protein
VEENMKRKTKEQVQKENKRRKDRGWRKIGKGQKLKRK